MKTPTKYYIYGLFVSGRCVYVGQTKNPSKRQSSHANRMMRGTQFDFRIFRVTDKQSVLRIERQIILSFKRRGFAEMNAEVIEWQDTGSPRTVKVEVSIGIGKLITKYANQRGLPEYLAIGEIVAAGLGALDVDDIPEPVIQPRWTGELNLGILN